MNDKHFLDTNILVYCYTSTELEKREKAQRAAKLPNTIISTQVLQEFSNTLRRKFQIPWDKISDGLHEIQKDFEVYINTEPTIFRACKIAEKYDFLFTIRSLSPPLSKADAQPFFLKICSMSKLSKAS